MKQLALKILKKAANYSGGAATGMAMAMAAGSGPVGAIGLAGSLALSLYVSSPRRHPKLLNLTIGSHVLRRG